jgi:hemoglobin
MSNGAERVPCSVYEAAGGEEALTRLVHRFYEEVAKDPALRAVYPSKDLGRAEENMRLFLIQYWGGPHTYSERRGHPRLRKRHMRLRIGPTERDLWLRHMRTALDDLALDVALDRQMWDYLVRGAHSLVNVFPYDMPASGGRSDFGLAPA